MMVSFGNASGAVPAIQPLILSTKGSLYLTRPTLASYCANREELLWRAGDVLRWLASGSLQTKVHQVYPFEQAAQAHIDLAGRVSAGKLLLKP